MSTWMVFCSEGWRQYGGLPHQSVSPTRVPMISTTSASLRTLWLSLTCGMVMASGEVSSNRPRAAQLVVTGACSNSATRRRAS